MFCQDIFEVNGIKGLCCHRSWPVDSPWLVLESQHSFWTIRPGVKTALSALSFSSKIQNWMSFKIQPWLLEHI
jgi:hypothetical protein